MSPSRLRRGLAALLLLAAGVLAIPALAQSPIQALQAQQAQQLLQQRANSPFGASQGAVQTLPSLVQSERLLNRQGTETQSEGGPIAVGPLGDVGRVPGVTAVFGASLFTRESTTVSEAPNPNYIISPGDRVSVRVWGAVEAEAVGVVDPSGMLFLPNIGPIRIAGTRSGDLQTVVESEVRRVFTSQVQVYAVLLTAQRIGVFVTGFVRTPGRYGGSASDTPLDFLVRAGGVDPSRGSYRDIAVQRANQTVVQIDLYRFLMDGYMPQLRLQEGDTIVVGRQRALVGADGAVRNNYFFEVPQRAMTGRELTAYARPLPSATNAVIRGSRAGQPFSRYVTLRELQTVPLADQDVVTFITDSPARTVRVTIEGSRIGPSVLVGDRETTLCQILNYVEVDPKLADTRSVFLLRQSVAAQQRRAIDEALDRLERQLFMAVSPTTGVAAIRSSEAQLVSSYIQRARRTQPEGRVVVMERDGRCAPVRLEDGDVIVVPERSQTVLVSGEVQLPRAVVWKPDMTITDFIKAAGGFAARGSDNAIMIRRASGEVLLDPEEPPRPGDELIALPRLDPKVFQIGSDLLGLIYQIAVATRIFI